MIFIDFTFFMVFKIGIIYNKIIIWTECVYFCINGLKLILLINSLNNSFPTLFYKTLLLYLLINIYIN